MATTHRLNGSSLQKTMAVVAVALCLTPVAADFTPVSAQEVIRRQNFFERLFGRRTPPPAVVEPQRVPRQQRRAPRKRQQSQQPSRAGRQQAAPAPAPSPAIEKLPNAKTVLVVGDFLAGGVAGGLSAAYEMSPGTRIEDRSNGSSGFVRNDYYDWNGSITPIIAEVDPAAIVVMIGSNDRQQISVHGETLRPQTEQWTEEYTKRVTEFAETLKKSNKPFLWVGLPPFKSPAMTSDMLAFNDVQKTAVEATGGTFIDIWDGFADENGAFTSTGPDMNGQPVRLRSSDGINLTREARRKIAFYLEKPLNQILGPAALPSVTPETVALPGSVLPQIEPEPAPKDLTRTGPISLSGPSLNSSGMLLGNQQQTVPSAASNLFKPQPGRADYRLQAKPKKEEAGSKDAPASE